MPPSRSDDGPLPCAPVRISRFAWPSHETALPAPGGAFRLRLGTRINGDAGIFPEAAEGEHELARFVIGYCRAVVPVGTDGRPLAFGKDGPLGEVCVGGGEMVLTGSRLCLVLIKATGALGKADDERGSVICVDVPFGSIGSIALLRRKRAFRGIKDRQLRCYLSRPAGALDIEPVAVFVAGEKRPVRIGLAAAYDQIVRAVCEDALSATLLEAGERDRLRLVRDGARTYDELDLVADITR
ncbi:hypothetical protein [Actinoplanes sp. RD1]|uniref:hypothetical protein n=1 Tax=Actinoplanes sp. RD1 TaxID=3064538 RepID=UPI0027406310|nr:hypothetical protein [Actinoplanes sp. RD1]